MAKLDTTGMSQEEIDEISEAFHDAWVDFFGEIMYYVPFDEESTQVHPVYRESIGKKRYKEDAKVLFHGTFKEVPIEEYGEIGGNRSQHYGEITFVTKELLDKGIKEIDMRAVIDVPDREGKTVRRYNIIAKDRKVQLRDNFVFTRIRVVRNL